ncbi:fungal-specific transcription factor domain-containing protein [Lipomyces arxii]|uniref:fungal-specific transcription factor domain-containing protein n=1 Tax=Lipomyces arxii TaxID=56418 RepID=UPI0034CF5E5A
MNSSDSLSALALIANQQRQEQHRQIKQQQQQERQRKQSQRRDNDTSGLRHSNPSLENSKQSEPSSKKVRSIAACNRCKLRKQRCDNAFPKCANCTKAGAECVSKEQAYPASYVHALEEHVQRLEEALNRITVQKENSLKMELPSISKHTSQSISNIIHSQKFQQQMHQQSQAQKQRQIVHQLPPISYVKTSTSSADQPASRNLIAMTHPDDPPPSYYLGSTSGFPLTKLVQAAISGRAIPKAFPIRADTPLNTPIHTANMWAAQSPVSFDNFSEASLLSVEPLMLSIDMPKSAASTEAQLTRAFLSTLPSSQMAQRLMEAYFNGVHMRYPFIYRGHILDWNARCNDIARELARVTAKSPIEAAAIIATMNREQPSPGPNAGPQQANHSVKPDISSGPFSCNVSGLSSSLPHVKNECASTMPAPNPSVSPRADTGKMSTGFFGVTAKVGPEYERHVKSLWFKLHMIYAIGARYLQLSGTYAYIAPDTHYHIAMRYLDVLLDSPLVDLIEKLLLVVVFQLRSPSGPGIWHLTGFSVRLCVEAGFHRKLNSSSVLEDQRRKKIFWCLYVLERSVSVTLGRPFCISDRDIDVDLPANVDEDIRDEKKLATAIANASANTLTSMTSAIFIMQIKRIASRIQEKIYRVDKSEIPSDKKFQKLRKELDDWGQQIISCKAFTPLSSTSTPRLFMSEEYYMLNYHANMRLLFVPQLPMLLSDTEEFKLCLRSSGELCQIYKRLHQYLRTVSYSFLALQASYMAGITLIYCYTKDPSILDAQFLADIRACSTVLYIIAERWPASVQFRDSFEAFLNSAIESGDFAPDSQTVTQARKNNVNVSSESTAAANMKMQPPVKLSAPMPSVSSSSNASSTNTLRFDMNLSSVMQDSTDEPTMHHINTNYDKYLRSAEKLKPLPDGLSPVQDELWDILQQGAQQDLSSNQYDMTSVNYFSASLSSGISSAVGIGMNSTVASANSGQSIQGHGLQSEQSQTSKLWPPSSSGIGNATFPSENAHFPSISGTQHRVGNSGWQNEQLSSSIQDMNAELRVGIGNAALFRCPGDFGDLYY